jgi:hypothetical protein
MNDDLKGQNKITSTNKVEVKRMFIWTRLDEGKGMFSFDN